MTSYEYENHYGDQSNGLSKGTILIPNRPPSRDPTRPRKQVDYTIMDQSQTNQSYG